MPRIPQEIVDWIIDESASVIGKKDMSSLGLTSRAFVPRARSHLFRHLNIDTSSCPIKNVKGWEEFHSILLQSPDISSCVRHVVLGKFSFQAYTHKDRRSKIPWPCPDCEDGDNTQHFSVDAMDQLRRRKASYVISTLALLPRVQQVVMDGQDAEGVRDDWNGLPSLVFKNSRGLFFLQSTITTLYIKTVQNLSTDFIRDLLQCSHLESLELEDVHIRNGTHNDSNAAAVEMSEKPLLESRLTSLRNFGVLSCTSRSRITLRDLINQVIRGAGSSLQNLKLVFPDENMSGIDVTPLKQLKVLSTMGLDTWDPEKFLPILREMVNSGSGKTLEVLEILGRTACTVSQIFPWLAGSQKERWGILDEALDHQIFSNLKEIRILFRDATEWDHGYVFIPCTQEESVAEVKSWLPRMASKSQVRITYEDMKGTNGLSYDVLVGH